MWKPPYSSREGSAIVAGLLVVGFMLQLSIGALNWDIFLWPANVITLTAFVIALLALFLLRRRVYLVRFMTTWQTAVPALVAVVFLTFLMGITRQVSGTSQPADPIGLSKMLCFWPFVLVYVWMTAIVGLEAISQVAAALTKKNRNLAASFPAILSHIGLFIVLTCGTLGSADMQRLKMYCEQGKPEWRALDYYNNVHELPVAIELQKFSIDEYPPKLMIIDKQGKPLPLEKPQTLTVDTVPATATLQDWKLSVLKQAVPNTPGTETSLMVKAVKGNVARQGWVTCGSYIMPWQSLKLDGNTTLVMAQREPKRYRSVVEIYTQDGKNMRSTIEVNHPVTVNGWKIYQYSYNEQMGKWSTLSIFELVKDPWLPVVYFGILLLAIGAVGMLFINKEK